MSELKNVVATLRAHVGNDARPTICFDRGGWSPALFKELSVAGFHLLTYRKAPLSDEPRSSFSLHVFSDDRGKRHEYWLADRQVAISYANKRRRILLRQITRLDPTTGHQTQILATRDDEDPGILAHLMFSRWRAEDFFRYMRAHFGLDALDSYATAAEDPERLVANPVRRAADKELAAARRSLQVAETAHGKAAFGGRPADSELRRAFRDAQAEVDRFTGRRSGPGGAGSGRGWPASRARRPRRPRLLEGLRRAQVGHHLPGAGEPPPERVRALGGAGRHRATGGRDRARPAAGGAVTDGSDPPGSVATGLPGGTGDDPEVHRLPPPDPVYATPTAAELLAAVRDFLRDAVLDAASGHTRYLVRVAASIVDMVRRQCEQGDEARGAHSKAPWPPSGWPTRRSWPGPSGAPPAGVGCGPPSSANGASSSTGSSSPS